MDKNLEFKEKPLFQGFIPPCDLFHKLFYITHPPLNCQFQLIPSLVESWLAMTPQISTLRINILHGIFPYSRSLLF